MFKYLYLGKLAKSAKNEFRKTSNVKVTDLHFRNIKTTVQSKLLEVFLIIQFEDVRHLVNMPKLGNLYNLRYHYRF